MNESVTAAQFGFQVVSLTRSGGQDDRIPGKAAARIESLSELAALLA